MKYLLTGATGYLGSHLLKALLQDNHKLTILKRSISDTRRIEPWIEQVSCFDIDNGGIERAFEKHAPFDAVIHTATCYGRNGESSSEILNTNLTFPLLILEHVADGGAKTFMNTDTPLPRDLNAYALSKKQFLEWGHQLSKQTEFQWINVILEHFYGPGDDESKLVTWLVRSCLTNTPEIPMTKGKQFRDFVHIEDVIRAFKAILNVKLTSSVQYHVGSGKSIKIQELANLIHNLCDSNSKFNFGELPYREKEVMESRADLTIMRKLGWSPSISLEEGLAGMIALEKGCLK